MEPTEQVNAGQLAAGDRIVRDGLVVTVTLADHGVPRRTELHLEGGGRIDVGKTTKMTRVVKLPAPPADAPVVTASIDELEVGDFVRWHGVPHRVVSSRPDFSGGITVYSLELRPWIAGTTADVEVGPHPAAVRFVRLPQYTDESPPLPASAAVDAMRPTASTVGRGPAADEQIAAEVDELPAELEAEGDTPVRDLEPPQQPGDVGPAELHLDSDTDQPQQISDGATLALAGNTLEPATAARLDAMRAALAAAPETLTLVVEVFRPAVTAAVYSSNMDAVDPALQLLPAPAPMRDEDAREQHRHTLDLIDLMFDEVPGWAAAGPWHADASGGFLIVFTRPVQRI